MSASNYNGVYDGSGMTVVIIDTGASKHVSNNNVVYSYDFADNDNDVYNPGFYHGGAVAQVAQDVASGINIIHLKVFGDNQGDKASLHDVEAALQWVIKNSEKYNIASVNMSLGFGNVTNYANNIYTDEYQKLDDLDIITTVAAGNFAKSYATDGINELAASESVIAVSAVDYKNKFADFSQKHSDLTDISALGKNVSVAGLTLSGTSYAAPVIAGAAAIIQQIALDKLGHKITDEQFLDLIQKTADKIDPASYSTAAKSTQPFALASPFSVKLMEKVDSVTPTIDPGNYIYAAYQLSPSNNQVQITDTLGGSDYADYYSFTLDNTAKVSVYLTGLDGDVDLILKDSSGQTLIYEWAWGNVDLDLSTVLTAGEQYFIGTDSWDSKSTGYKLSINFNGGIDVPDIPNTPDPSPDTPSTPDTPDAPDAPKVDYVSPDKDPGDYIYAAYQLSPSNSQVEITDALGGSDDKDYYSFTLDNTAKVSINLSGLDGDVDLLLKDSFGHTLIHEWAWGNVDLDLSGILNADEKYFIVTDSWDNKSTGYKLSINFNDGIDFDTPNVPGTPTNPEPPAAPAPATPSGYAGVNVANAAEYFQEHIQDYAVV